MNPLPYITGFFKWLFGRQHQAQSDNLALSHQQKRAEVFAVELQRDQFKTQRDEFASLLEAERKDHTTTKQKLKAAEDTIHFLSSQLQPKEQPVDQPLPGVHTG